MRYLMIITYDGRDFCGWQRQKNANSIQESLEDKLSFLLKENIKCTASGRTDAKVSAYFQPVHFDCNTNFDMEKIKNSLNALLPNSIKVLSIKQTDLHARFSAKKKTYLYKMYLSNIDLPLFSDALRIDPNIDVGKMKKFAKLLCGRHDFLGFRASNAQNESTERTIYNVKLKKNGLYLYFYITGNGFLYKMVRNIVGTMLQVGMNRINLKELKKSLFSTFKSTHTAPAEFLYLLQVNYS